ncbi:MAG: hypothetical protein ACKO5F_12045 [Synechococcus sp.]
MAAIVISDGSPLTALPRVNGIGWLKALFQEVVARTADDVARRS